MILILLVRDVRVTDEMAVMGDDGKMIWQQPRRLVISSVCKDAKQFQIDQSRDRAAKVGGRLDIAPCAHGDQSDTVCLPMEVDVLLQLPHGQFDFSGPTVAAGGDTTCRPSGESWGLAINAQHAWPRCWKIPLLAQWACFGNVDLVSLSHLERLAMYDSVLVIESASKQNLLQRSIWEDSIYTNLWSTVGNDFGGRLPHLTVWLTGADCNLIHQRSDSPDFTPNSECTGAEVKSFLKKEEAKAKRANFPTRAKFEFSNARGSGFNHNEQLDIHQAVDAFTKRMLPQTLEKLRGNSFDKEDVFIADVKALQTMLTKSPADLPRFQYEPCPEEIAGMFGRFQVGMIGRAGSGKSTTLRWLSYYAGVELASRKDFSVVGGDQASHTMKLTERHFQLWTSAIETSKFVGMDTRGIDYSQWNNIGNSHNTSWATWNLEYLLQGQVASNCIMDHYTENPVPGKPETLSFGHCTPWSTKPDNDRRMHVVVYVAQYISECASEDGRQTKKFVSSINSHKAFVSTGRKLVIALTHMDQCDAELIEAECTKAFAECVGVSIDFVVPMQNVHEKVAGGVGDKYDFLGAEFHELLDGKLEEEAESCNGIYLQPRSIRHLLKTIQDASQRYYETVCKDPSSILDPVVVVVGDGQSAGQSGGGYMEICGVLVHLGYTAMHFHIVQSSNQKNNKNYQGAGPVTLLALIVWLLANSPVGLSAIRFSVVCGLIVAGEDLGVVKPSFDMGYVHTKQEQQRGNFLLLSVAVQLLLLWGFNIIGVWTNSMAVVAFFFGQSSMSPRQVYAAWVSK